MPSDVEARLREAAKALADAWHDRDGIGAGRPGTCLACDVDAALDHAEPPDSLDAAWRAAEEALPEGNDLWLAATGPGYVASSTYPGADRAVESWAQSDPSLPNYVPNATPAAALQALSARLNEADHG